MALHHKLCHTLGGSFNLPHAEVHTIILPHAAAYNAPAAPEAMGRVARALGVGGPERAAGAIFDLAKSCGAKMSLAAIGMREADLDKAAELALAAPYPNPRPLERAAIRELLGDAFQGRRPNSEAQNKHAHCKEGNMTKNISKASLSRRRVLQAGGAAVAAGGFGFPAIAAEPVFKIGYVTPKTGPLAPFAEADISSSLIQEAARQGRVGRRQDLKVEIYIKDSQSNPNRAAEVAAN